MNTEQIRKIKSNLSYLRLFRSLGILGFVHSIKALIAQKPILLHMKTPFVKFPIFLRMPSSDVAIFDKVFIRKEFDFKVKRHPDVIIDAGANIGLSSIYFANNYPGARIIAIEPEESNFEILIKNVAAYKNITPVKAALWYENTTIKLFDPGQGKWGFIVKGQDAHKGKDGNPLCDVLGLTINNVMEKFEISHIDILKIDIEGAEKEVFNHSHSWIEKVDSLIVELHDSIKTGCKRSFYNGTNGFDDEWTLGEHVLLARNAGCIMAPTGL